MARKLIFYKTYFLDFFAGQDERTKEKIDYVLAMISTVERVPVKFLKHLEGTDGLYEIRVKSGGNIFRVFCFFDEGNLVVLLQGFQEKTDKTPRNELQRAEKIKQEYFETKPNQP